MAAPSRADSLERVAPALVVTVECDPTRDEAEEYADRLARSGVVVELRRLDGLIHGVLNMSAFVPRVQEIHTQVADFVAAQFAARMPTTAA